jgi:hypothetical protein
MKALLTCLLLFFNRFAFADALNGSYTGDLLSWRSLAAIKPRPTHTDDYQLVMTPHLTVVSKNLSLVSFRDPILEGWAHPENGSPRVRIRPSSYPADRHFDDVQVASEPSSLAMLGTGLLGLALWVRRRIKHQPVKAE